jgi:hypothetical protein
MNLIPYPHLVPTLRVYGAIPPPPIVCLHDVDRDNFTFTLVYVHLSLQFRSIQIVSSELYYQTISIQIAITLQIYILRGT